MSVRLYSDVLLPIYFALASVYGGYTWTHAGPNADAVLRMTRLLPGTAVVWSVVAIAAFARPRCDDSGLDRLVPFSRNGRAFCPSCGGRRMAERTVLGFLRRQAAGADVPNGRGGAMAIIQRFGAALNLNV